MIPLAEIRDRVAADWTAEETGRRLATLAEQLKGELDGGLSLADLAARLSRPVQSAGPVARSETAPDLPPGLIAAVFVPEASGTAVALGGVALASVTEILPFDAAAPGAAPVVQSVTEQMRAQAAEDVLTLMAQAVQASEGLQVDQALLERVLAQFP